jgi:hypothetical protein
MMTPTEALVTAARRYLIDNHRYWAERYTKERTGDNFPEYTYTDNDYNLFPRYNMLHAILGEVETLVGQNHLNIEAGKQALKSMGLNAGSSLMKEAINKIERAAMQEEREKFIRFIDQVSPDNLAAVEPLPHRRRLTEEEKQVVRQELLTHWNFQGNYWEPLEELSPQPAIFLMKENISDNDYVRITEEIQKHADGFLFEITEDGADAEITFPLFHPDCYETIYCDKTYDWIVYGSHERTVAFGGTWLLAFINQLFANRKELLNKWANSSV